MLIRSVLLLCGLLMASVGARAAPTLVLSGSTIIGVDGVVVGATTYNPRFLDGTCASVYGACDSVHFTFPGPNSGDSSAVVAADTALRNALISLSATNANDYNGCAGSVCEILDPWWLLGVNNVWTSSLFVQSGTISNALPFSSEFTDVDEASRTDRVWVQWTPLAEAAPEPASLTLFGVALAGTGLLGRRRRRG